ncbi:tetratricopeptide repeat protein [Desulfovibrio oxyclinae]|uniref:tetratricopeptide repeat protein n=1 Tax=Desulfovibrio oxyclinae TaxID=63560 RepID=UPI000372E72A|nr:tetratricopeptide repeat protein [Desulfovibrio oxyclinae]
MKAKIEWYQEVLSLEPGSKVFFPLAKLFVELGNLDDAAVTLRKGLDRHPDFFEARLLLIHVLTELGREEEVHSHLDRAVSPLRENQSFWRNWARSLTKENRDLAVFLMLVSANLSGEKINWTDVVFEGIGSLSRRLVGEPLPAPSAEAASEPVMPSMPEVEEIDGHIDEEDVVRPDSGSLRTRTMAELLASQGDNRGALEIYKYLLSSAPAESRPAIEERIAELQTQVGGQTNQAGEDPFSTHSKSRLLSTLELLAARFEARAAERGRPRE